MIIHPAFKYSYQELYEGLEANVALGYISVKEKWGLRLYNYTPLCTFDKAWNDFTKIARGLILNPQLRKIECLGFPKFFNYGEVSETLPNLPFTVTEKVDGSMGLCYYNRGFGCWKFATRGSFDSEQAIEAENIFNGYRHYPDIADACFPMTHGMDPSLCYLFEIIYPGNRIVVDYKGKYQLILLGAYNRETGEEIDVISDTFPMSYDGNIFGFLNDHQFSSIEDIIAHGANIKGIEGEGVVVRYSNGYRVKVKYEDYCRLHRTISRITPLAIWEHINNGDNLEAILLNIPEEFRRDFEIIKDILVKNGTDLIVEAEKFWLVHRHLDRKSFALKVNSQADKWISALCFKMYSKGSLCLNLQDVAKLIRPKNNVLPGYVPSNSMNRFAEEG
jgi:RNA ligase